MLYWHKATAARSLESSQFTQVQGANLGEDMLVLFFCERTIIEREYAQSGDSAIVGKVWYGRAEPKSPSISKAETGRETGWTLTLIEGPEKKAAGG